MKQNKEGFESKEAPEDLTSGVKSSTVKYGSTLDGCSGAEQVGGSVKPPFTPGK